jgi:selenium metabolism protein YedF
MENLDCRGLTCPHPVMETRDFLSAHPECAEISVQVDNLGAAQNVERFLRNQGFQVTIQGSDPDFKIYGQRSESGNCKMILDEMGDKPQKTLIMITQAGLGRGDDDLGNLLMLNFLRTLKEMGKALWRLILVNAGVKLTIEGAESLPVLKELEGEGISIWVCGTCLNHFNLLEKKQCGETTNMLDIVTSLQVADKVITF